MFLKKQKVRLNGQVTLSPRILISLPPTFLPQNPAFKFISVHFYFFLLLSFPFFLPSRYYHFFFFLGKMSSSFVLIEFFVLSSFAFSTMVSSSSGVRLGRVWSCISLQSCSFSLFGNQFFPLSLSFFFFKLKKKLFQKILLRFEIVLIVVLTSYDYFCCSIGLFVL